MPPLWTQAFSELAYTGNDSAGDSTILLIVAEIKNGTVNDIIVKEVGAQNRSSLGLEDPWIAAEEIRRDEISPGTKLAQNPVGFRNLSQLVSCED